MVLKWFAPNVRTNQNRGCPISATPGVTSSGNSILSLLNLFLQKIHFLNRARILTLFVTSPKLNFEKKKVFTLLQFKPKCPVISRYYHKLQLMLQTALSYALLPRNNKRFSNFMFLLIVKLSYPKFLTGGGDYNTDMLGLYNTDILTAITPLT